MLDLLFYTVLEMHVTDVTLGVYKQHLNAGLCMYVRSSFTRVIKTVTHHRRHLGDHENEGRHTTVVNHTSVGPSLNQEPGRL